jgi:hypothetical protein
MKFHLKNIQFECFISLIFITKSLFGVETYIINTMYMNLNITTLNIRLFTINLHPYSYVWSDCPHQQNADKSI